MDAEQPQIVRARMPVAQLPEFARRGFGVIVKAADEVDRRTMAIGGELHAHDCARLPLRRRALHQADEST